MNSSKSSFYPSSDGNLYNGSAGPNSHAHRSINDTDDKEPFIKAYVIYVSIIASIEIPIICLAVYAVYFLIKSNQSTPVFVINLLISDLIQIVCMLLFTIPLQWLTIMLMKTIFWAVFTGLYFMTCIAVERYVMIAHPIWHRSHRSVKSLVCTSLSGWIVSFIVFTMIHIEIELFFIPFIFYVVIIFCFVGTCRSLSHSKTLTPLKKQLVLAPLLFVVISYTFLILPVNILAIVYIKWDKSIGSLMDFTVVLYLLNPLVDCLLYVLMRSDVENIISTPHCCFRLKRVQSETRHVTSTDVQHDHV